MIQPQKETALSNRIQNTIYGLALGDGLSYAHEFTTNNDMLHHLYNLKHREIGTENRIFVSDDTQMSLYLLYAVQDWYDDNKRDFTYHVGNNFLQWLNDPRNNRAPGYACMTSLSALFNYTVAQGFAVDEDLEFLNHLGHYMNPDSMGSGTVMRSPWLGLIGAVGTSVFENEVEVLSYAYKQSEITHGHPGAHEAAALAAYITYHLIQGADSSREGLLQLVRGYINKYQGTILVLTESIPSILEKLDSIPYEWYEEDDYHSNIDNFFRGWSAVGVLGSALAIFGACQNDIIRISNRCSFSNQDSDTVGAIAGAFAGAITDDSDWNATLIPKLEKGYLKELKAADTFVQGLVI